jgi:rubrerythrin
MDEQTRANLLQAMHEEAFARAKFLLFAANAEAAGEDEAAELLRRSAAAQQDHFERMAELYELSRTVVDDLGDAIATEVRTDYQGYAGQAHRVGEIEVARLFETIHSFKAAQREALGSVALRLKLDRGRAPQPPAERPREQREFSVAIAPDDADAEPEPAAVPEPAPEAEPEGEPEPDPDAGQPEVASPAKVEYRTVHVRKSARKGRAGAAELERQLNQLADEGWVLAHAIGAQLIFQR